MNESICIPFSVYTAWRGYGWSSVPEDVPQQELDELYRMIGEYRPDFMGPGDAFEGVYFRNWLLAAFRMQSVPKWDSVGRDADYCAFAFMGLDVVRRFDFDALLSLPAFCVPTHTPADGIEYDGPTSAAYAIPVAMELRESHQTRGADFRSVGDMLAACADYCDDWLFTRTHFRGTQTLFTKTGAWTGEPASWQAEHAKRKAKFQKINLKEINMALEGLS